MHLEVCHLFLWLYDAVVDCHSSERGVGGGGKKVVGWNFVNIIFQMKKEK